MITIYKCETCGVEFDDWDKCYDHEDKHIKPKTVGVQVLSHVSPDVDLGSTRDPHPYPLDISMPMTDGAVVQYAFSRVLQGAIDSEPEHKEAAADAG